MSMEKDNLPGCINEIFLNTVAPVLKQKIIFVRPLLNRFGPGALEIIRETVKKETEAEWKGWAEKEGNSSMENLVDLLWNRLCKPLGFEFTLRELPGAIQIHCTRCPIAEYAAELDALDLGYEFHCAQDPYIAASFGRGIGFRQTKWIMKGDCCCDHYYFIQNK